MDKEYIEREAVLKSRPEYKNPHQDGVGTYNKGWNDCAREFFYHIKEATAADVVEVKHGRWIENEDGETVCTECGVRIPEMYSNADSILQGECKFCHNCGAKMDGEKLLTWIPKDNWELGCEYECPYCAGIIDIPHGDTMPHKCGNCGNEIGVK